MRKLVLFQNLFLSLLMSAGAIMLFACGGSGDNSNTNTSAPNTSIANSTPVLSAASAQILNLDLSQLQNYAAPIIPSHYDAAVAALDNTPTTTTVLSAASQNAIATLGRVLFYDKQLSLNNTVACASCHQQSKGFSDSNVFSTGFAGGLTSKHAMRLGNLRFYSAGSMFWDKRAASAEIQSTQPIQNATEMGFDAAHGGFNALVTKMQGLVYYPELFQFAYGDSTISEARIQQALAMFQRGMVSTASKFDTGYAQVHNPSLPLGNVAAPFTNFSVSENSGKVLFLRSIANGGAGCAACHVPPSFSLAVNSRSNGLDATETTIFKSPSLKNIELSGTFMHDGRFSSLAQVIEHYDSGVKTSPATDARLLLTPGGAPRLLNLTAQDKTDLVNFLLTLTDTTLNNDPKFATPFR